MAESVEPAAPVEPGALVTLPNAITFARLCAVPIAMWLVLRRDMAGAFWLFVAAGISDAVDGFLARRVRRAWGGGASTIGAVLDPIADKALLVTMYVALAVVDVLPDWIAILVVFRDAVIVGGVLLLAVLGQKVAIRPLYVSKVNTALQIFLIAGALMAAAFAPGFAPAGMPLVHAALRLAVWVVAASTLVSGAAYVALAARLL